ncbi:SWIM zinc finger family protein [Histoplasma ohiense]|nr:SWIM zinc finger family protein [Histoplasma ohiense (nom. inval.)]
MSAPTKQLGNLSLGGRMSTTRGQAERRGAVDDEEENSASSSSGEEEVEDSAPGSTKSLVTGNSAILYNVSGLSGEVRARALSGILGKFVVDKCRASQDGYDFQVLDHGLVHLGNGPMTCSCSEYGDGPKACRHIFWLVDQLHRLTLPKGPGPGISLSRTGQSPNFPPLYELIGGRMEDILIKARWALVDDPSSPEFSEQESGTSMSRPEKVRDILSAFSEATMPDDFRPDQAETIRQPRTPEQCVVQGDFEATMFRLAVHDDNVYRSLRKAMPAPARCAIFFDKVQKKTRALLVDFDRYCQYGTPQRDGTALEIRVVVERLHELVSLVAINIAPRAPDSHRNAPDALIGILRDVVTYNYNAFDGNAWGRISPAGETENDCNLFAQVIGQPEVSGQYFVLDVLESLPRAVLKEWEPQLVTIMSKIPMSNQSMVTYLQQFQVLLNREFPATGFGVTASGHKRPAGGASGSGRKRPK